MIPRIKSIKPGENYILHVTFEDGKNVKYDVKEDISAIEQFLVLKERTDLFESVKLDDSRTCVFWNDEIDLPSDIIYEYGKRISSCGESVL